LINAAKNSSKSAVVWVIFSIQKLKWESHQDIDQLFAILSKKL
jgi:hypothetical protein